MADEDVANAVQAHPSLPVLATSGIESTVKVRAAPGCRARRGTGRAERWPGLSTRRQLRLVGCPPGPGRPHAPVPLPCPYPCLKQLWSPEGEPTPGGDIAETVRRNQERLKEGG